jgi:sec-independent protein translocase protein TatB
MFDIGSSELLLIIIVAVVVIGPKDLPRVLYKLGQIIGKGRAMTRHFRAGIDEMVRQAEMEEMEKKWASDNARIMAQPPVDPDAVQPALTAPETTAGLAASGPEAAPHAEPAHVEASKTGVPATPPPFVAEPAPKSENGPTA